MQRFFLTTSARLQPSQSNHCRCRLLVVPPPNELKQQYVITLPESAVGDDELRRVSNESPTKLDEDEQERGRPQPYESHQQGYAAASLMSLNWYTAYAYVKEELRVATG